ncbi:GNAT family N-acetyltransferase [Bordetella petrii]|uniref:GNAT family N-acetyltransferase n=1 Tax=Bordetella petrii TaxID=94624 RepID=UPI001A973B29|nr:GNAT family N-acetyltransferase [Bordetella petrii]MBO1113535.1 GNAT family N-acetyltransferase [Bordetella petrii]
MSCAVSIRSVRPDDFAAWKPLWDGYNAFYGRTGVTALPDDITRTTWARFFDGYEPMHALVAEADGALLGLVHYLFHRSTTALGPNCYLQDLYTLPAARGRGVGRALIEAVYQQAQAAHCGRVYWQTQEGNATARRLYDQVADQSGFIVYRKVF